VTVTATVDDGYTFANDEQSMEFPHTFGPVIADCDFVPPPSPPTSSAVATPTVVSAGIITPIGSSSVSDVRTEQGIALLASGLLLLVAAGGLALRRAPR